jgi:hypothetical protein
MRAIRHKSSLSVALLIVLAGSLFARVTQSQELAAEPALENPRLQPAELSLLMVEPVAQDPQDDELRKLLKARYNEAVGEFQARFSAFQAGRDDIDTLPEAGQRVVESGLELTDKPEQRIGLLTQKVELMRMAEGIANSQLAGGMVPVSEVHKACYQRFDAELELLRARREGALQTIEPGVEDPQEGELRKLLKARYNEAVAEFQARFRAFEGRGDGIDTLLMAGQRVVESGTELADKPEQRIVLLTQIVENMRAAEAIAKVQLAGGSTTVSDVHKACYQRLDGEIKLLRVRREGSLQAIEPGAQDPQDGELRKLLKARYDEAVAEFQASFRAFEAVRGNVTWLYEAGQRVVESGLELTDKPEERIALLTLTVENMRKAEAIAKANLEGGEATVSEVHKACFQRLGGEIRLLRAYREANHKNGK